ncbi:MAG TPA: type I-E CRISPR-associated protein Cse2/CasB [Thermoanaerobaculia bacterium]|jgi:CRISPR system Cascade subunit CasB|nr:type I-E CRISPR-associated protein Cse2/CasB [Thermoanaerobaculia bacterium]
MKPSFSHADHEERGKALLEWRDGLANDKGSRARLRRAASPDEVAFEPAFHRLLARLRPSFRVDDPQVRRNLAALAALAARVREHTADQPLALQMGTAGARKSSAGPAVSEQRFRRLLTTSSLDDRYSQLARVIHLLGGKVDLLSLADAVVDWEVDPDLRQRWAYDYYRTALS